MRINALCSDIEHNASKQKGTDHIGPQNNVTGGISMHHNVADHNYIQYNYSLLNVAQYKNTQHNDTKQEGTDHIGKHHSVIGDISI